MTPALRETLDFLRQHDLKTILARIRQREVPGLIQFAVYSACGGLATVAFLATVIGLSKTLYPAYEGMFVAKEATRVFGYALFWPAESQAAGAQAIPHSELGDNIRAANLLVNNCVAFVIANIVAYITNVLFVFKSGRHHPALEFLYFTLVSGIAFGASQIAGPWLVKKFGLPTNLAILSNVLASMMLNFVGRKFFVFKG